jgi:NhaP-type Na+/H+ and K+/H+ antiporter
VLFLLVIRPLAGWLGLIRSGLPARHRLLIAGLGIRGVGTFYYLAYGVNFGNLTETAAREIWSAAGWIVLLSVILHGALAPRFMRRLGQP